MKENGISVQLLPYLVLFSLFIVNFSILCAVIEMKNITQHIQVFSLEDVLARSIFLSEQHPTALISTFTLINKRFYKKFRDIISEIVTMINEAKGHRTAYDCTDLRKNWLINQIHMLDTTLHFTLFKDLGRKVVISCNPVTQSNLTCLNRCVNYLSLKTDLPVYTLSHMFRCLKYLKYYTFLYGDRWSLYEPYSECTLL